MTLITEDTDVVFKDYSDLSYFDFEDETISLYINNTFEGDCKVWKDSEMDGREYIILNYEIVYLDTLNKM